ncbi:hypothetical protein [Halosolutus gelatinilyticus]|uniref:hypothetical protein n=1 Tax=Halosolutus gelatinilyticus TaxID=2931975 RepID=UPI001FF4CD39|nr:hypothetical protein [Halosolutus gelatinilyticus]
MDPIDSTPNGIRDRIDGRKRFFDERTVAPVAVPFAKRLSDDSTAVVIHLTVPAGAKGEVAE